MDKTVLFKIMFNGKQLKQTLVLFFNTPVKLPQI